MDDFRVFWATRMIFGSFRSFQNFEPKILKKIQVTLNNYHFQLSHFLKGFVIFLSIPSYGILRKITKPFKKWLSWPWKMAKVKISEIDNFHNITKLIFLKYIMAAMLQTVRKWTQINQGQLGPFQGSLTNLGASGRLQSQIQAILGQILTFADPPLPTRSNFCGPKWLVQLSRT